MTNEELAKHWGVSLDEVKRISNIMNANFYCGIAQRRSDKLFYGVMYTLHETPSGSKTPLLLVSSKIGSQTETEAIQNWNKLLDRMALPKLRAKILGVPQDAYKTLIKIPEPVRTAERHIVSIWRDKEHTKG